MEGSLHGPHPIATEGRVKGRFEPERSDGFLGRLACTKSLIPVLTRLVSSSAGRSLRAPLDL